jgi:hypothetical protein
VLRQVQQTWMYASTMLAGVVLATMTVIVIRLRRAAV